MEINLQSIFDDAMKRYIEAILENMLLGKTGHGLNTDIQQAIREHAKQLIVNDPEIQKLIKERILHWIK